MKPKTMILMGLAVACGLGASYMTSRLLAERTPAEAEKIEILVAKRNLQVGETLTKPEELFEKKMVAVENAPPEAIKDLASLEGKIMKVSRNKGDTVAPTNLRGINEILDIPEGHFAMGLRVNLEGSAAGFATLPKSRVNIIHTGRDADGGYSQVLLENVLVLAADLKINSEGELASPAQVVTFALTGRDLLKVNLAKDNGTLSLALRRLDETGTLGPLELRTKDLRQSKQTPFANAKIEPIKPATTPEQPDEPEFTRGYYDIVSGTEKGIREVWRVFYYIDADGEVVIERTVLFDSVAHRNTGGAKQGAPGDL